MAANVTITASFKADQVRAGANQVKGELGGLRDTARSATEKMAEGMAKTTIQAELMGRATSRASDVARAGAIAATKAEQDFQAAIQRVVAGTDSAADRSKALAAARREGAAAAKAHAEAEKLAAQAAGRTSEAMGPVHAALQRVLGPVGEMGAAFRGGGAMAAGALVFAGAIGGAVMALRGLHQTLAAAVTEAGHAENVMSAFRATITGLGQDVGLAEAVVQKFTSSLADDEAVAAAVRNLSIMGLGFKTQEQVIGRIRDIAVQAGGDVDKAMESMSQAILAQQTRALKSMGIVVDLGEAQKRYAKAMDITGRALTEVEGQIAFVDEFMRKSAFADGSAEGAVLGYDQAVHNMNRSYTNMLETLGSSEGVLGQLARWWVDARAAVFDYINEVNRVPGGATLRNQFRILSGQEDQTGALRAAPVFGTSLMTPERAAKIARGEITAPRGSVSPEDQAAGRAEEQTRRDEKARADAEETEKKAEEATKKRREKARGEAQSAAKQIGADQQRLREQLAKSLALADKEGTGREREQAMQAHQDRLRLAHRNRALELASRKQYLVDLHGIDEKEAKARVAADEKESKERADAAGKAGANTAKAYLAGLSKENPVERLAVLDRRINEVRSEGAAVYSSPAAQAAAAARREGELGVMGEAYSSGRGDLRDARTKASGKIEQDLAEFALEGADLRITQAQRERDETLKIAQAGSQLALDAETLFQLKRKKIIDDESAAMAMTGINLADALLKGNAGGALKAGTDMAAKMAPEFAKVVGPMGAAAGLMLDAAIATHQAGAELVDRAQGARLSLTGGTDRYGGRHLGRQQSAFVVEATKKERAALTQAAGSAERRGRELEGAWWNPAAMVAAPFVKAREEREIKTAQMNLDAAERQAQAAIDQQEAAKAYRSAVDSMNAGFIQGRLGAEREGKVLDLDLKIGQKEREAQALEKSDPERAKQIRGEVIDLERDKSRIVEEGRLESEARAVGANIAKTRGGSEDEMSAIAQYAATMFKQDPSRSVEDVAGALGQTYGRADLFTPEALAYLKTLATNSTKREGVADQDAAGAKDRLKPGETPQNPLYTNVVNFKDMWASEPPSARFRSTGRSTTRSQSITTGGNVKTG